MIRPILSLLMIIVIAFGHGKLKATRVNLSDLIGELQDYSPISAPLFMLGRAVSYSAEVYNNSSLCLISLLIFCKFLCFGNKLYL